MDKRLLSLAAMLLATSLANLAYSQGVYISSAGPINRSMGGASTAAPISALSAMYWNPASISGMENTELEVGVDLLFADHNVTSTVGGTTGSTDAEPGTFPVPNFAWTHRLQDPRFTFGLGVNSVAGFKTSLPSSTTNPVLAPQPTGLGQITSEASFLQIAPVLSMAVTERMSIAAGPTVTTGQVGIEPFVFDSVNGDNTYSSGRATRYHWGGGFQLGSYFLMTPDWQLGASYKSKAWMETFEFTGADENGLPRTLTCDLDLPSVISLGTGYTGFDQWLFAADIRYFDYANADGFGDDATYDGTGKLGGLDWSSVFAIAVGAQRSIGERLVLRGGYSYNQNPIRESESFFNMASPLIYEHVLSMGGSYNLNEKVAVNLAWSHYFENTRTGAVILPGVGAVPGSSITNRLSADFLSFGIVMKH
ncbi:OmpP1/FadL family transporter [Rhodopirellula europaea]|uniref:Membrane protein involved in aromatic hydrocarbon degradation n=1 Tax=Rhodopirellula europaea SH398 TaxID=1263868 RepID=M5S6F6_9BACT|nr:outer membrane protein transport protein [Rhodopirellula europaea]EMI23237.1 membrane protein involved in aromatic hydrocarbon degradation [Rhodopirellula europaea SH398]